MNATIVCSADHFFITNGEFKFDPTKLGEAHSACLRKYVEAINEWETPTWSKEKKPPALKIAILRGLPGSGKTTWADKRDGAYDIIVDNTNTTVAELAPYVAVGQAYGHSVTIFELECSPDDSVRRNTHGVSPVTIGMMVQRMRSEPLPPWWARVVVKS